MSFSISPSWGFFHIQGVAGVTISKETEPSRSITVSVLFAHAGIHSVPLCRGFLHIQGEWRAFACHSRTPPSFPRKRESSLVTACGPPPPRGRRPTSILSSSLPSFPHPSVLPARALDFSVIVITILVCSLLIDCWRDSDR